LFGLKTSLLFLPSENAVVEFSFSLRSAACSGDLKGRTLCIAAGASLGNRNLAASKGSGGMNQPGSRLDL